MGKRFNLFDKFGNEIGTATEGSEGWEGLIVVLLLIVTLGVFYLAYKLIIAVYESFRRMDSKAQRRFLYICVCMVAGGMLAFIVIALIQYGSVLNTSGPLSTMGNSDNCGQALKPHLTVGQNVVVTTAGDDLILHAGDGLSQPKIDVLSTGTRGIVVDGPYCMDGYQWWKLMIKQKTGWAVESDGNSYWLQQP